MPSALMKRFVLLALLFEPVAAQNQNESNMITFILLGLLGLFIVGPAVYLVLNCAYFQTQAKMIIKRPPPSPEPPTPSRRKNKPGGTEMHNLAVDSGSRYLPAGSHKPTEVAHNLAVDAGSHYFPSEVIDQAGKVYRSPNSKSPNSKSPNAKGLGNNAKPSKAAHELSISVGNHYIPAAVLPVGKHKKDLAFSTGDHYVATDHKSGASVTKALATSEVDHYFGVAPLPAATTPDWKDHGPPHQPSSPPPTAMPVQTRSKLLQIYKSPSNDPENVPEYGANYEAGGSAPSPSPSPPEAQKLADMEVEEVLRQPAAVAETQHASMMKMYKVLSPSAKDMAVEIEERDLEAATAEASGYPPTPFVVALRWNLGLKEARAPSLGASNEPRKSASRFDGDVEDALRTLFLKCDRDKNGVMGRAEFNHAVQLLKLDYVLRDIGGDGGMIVGLERLFQDLASAHGKLDEEGFLTLLLRIEMQLEAAKSHEHASLYGEAQVGALEGHRA